MTSSVTAVITAVAAVLVSPLLASWTLGLTTDQGAPTDRWWHPRPVGPPRLVLVAVTAAVLTVAAIGGVPLVPWWLFATSGSVLCVVDVQRHLLPGRFVYPLAAVVFAALGVSAVLAGEPERLLRAFFATAVVGVVWFVVAFTAPYAMGLGDVRLAALAAGLLGWTSWSAVLAGQLATFGLAVVTAAILAMTRPHAGRAMQVPMGPALITGAIIATWL